MSWNGSSVRNPAGKWVKRGIERKIADTHIEAVNHALQAGLPHGAAFAMGDMAVRSLMANEQDQK